MSALDEGFVKDKKEIFRRNGNSEKCSELNSKSGLMQDEQYDTA